MSFYDDERGARPDRAEGEKEMSEYTPLSSVSAPLLGPTTVKENADRKSTTFVKETTTVSHSHSRADDTPNQHAMSDLIAAPKGSTMSVVTATIETTTSTTTSKATASSSIVAAAVGDADISSSSNNVADTTADQDASMEYDVDDDGGVIRCICECDDDDGFTIQCDKCLVWQHCACFGMSQASVPDEYHCEQCDPRPVDVEFAKAHQQRRREAELKKASIERSVRRQNSVNAAAIAAYNDSVISDPSMDGLINNYTDGIKGQLNNLGNPPGGINRSRKPSQQLDLTNVTFASVEGPPSASATPGTSRANRKKGSAMKSGGGTSKRSSNGDMQGMAATTPRGVSLLASNNASSNSPSAFRSSVDDRLDFDDFSDRLEAWQVEFTPVTQNITTEESITSMLASMMSDYANTSSMKADRGTGNRMIAPVIGKKVKTLVNLNGGDDVIKALDQDAANVVNEIKEEDVGLTAIGDECIPIELVVSDLAICTQRTYVKQISELASASIFNSLLQVNPLPSEPQRPWAANRIFNKPVMHGLFADVSIPAGCFIQEYIGELSNADTYRRDPINQYHQIGASKPNVHLFPPPLNLCIDARRYGNTSRFARFSCHPNAVLRPVVLTATSRSRPDAEQSNTVSHRSGEIKFGLFAISDIPRTHEITLGWEWDDAHVVHILPQLVRNPLLGILDAPSNFSLNPPTRGGNQRALERERRHAAVTALVEKGDFPYAGTAFSQKMNSVLTVLLSSCLCACIGSASAPNGISGNFGGSSNSSNNSASSNNMKRQDCAISQMLRLSQGMTLLNVHIPGSSQATGKSNRKSKAPDFEPLVGKRRWWRPDAMPMTPRSSEGRDEDATIRSDKDDLYRDLDVPFKIIPGGRVGRVEELDFERAIKRQEISARMKKLRQDMDLDVIGEDESDEANESDASSLLTEPLPHKSDNEEEEEEDDSLLLDDNNVTIAKDEKGASFLTRTALPPKKRVSGTRLKAVLSGDENSDVEYKGKRKRTGDGKSRSIREERRNSDLKKKKKKKKKRIHEQSSPLTSAPSDMQSGSEESDDVSQDATPTPPSKKLLSNRSDKSKRSSRPSEEGKDEVERIRKAEAKARKKASLIKKRRRELLGEYDEEVSDNSGDVPDESNGHKEHPVMSSPIKMQARKKNASKTIVYSDDEEEQIAPEVTIAGAEGDAVAMGDDNISAPSVVDATAPEVEDTVAPILAPPPPPIEVPKAKLSLADYKKRLAERRTTSANSQGPVTPLTTPGLMVQSPEKASNPNTPLSSMGTTGGFAFPPPPTSTAMPVSMAIPSPDVIMTPNIPTPRIDFAPPPPRFPRPMTPPRSISGSVTPSAVTAALHDSPSSSKKEIAPIEEDVSRQSLPTSVEAARSTSNGDATDVVTADTFSSADRQAAIPVEITSTVSELPPARSASTTTVEGGISSRKKAVEPLPIDSDLYIPRSRGSSFSTAAMSAIAAGDTSNNTITSSSTTTTTTFNPPKAPRAFINPSAPPAGSPPPATTISTLTTTAASPPANIQEQRQGRTALSYEGLHPTSARNPSPTRPPIASPVSSFGGSYSSQIAGQSSFGDFANVPKGPARMRERERERDIRERDLEEREFREPLPPLRDRDREREREWEWERERERERLERERDREYLLRDAAYLREQPIPYREREYPYDRRRLEEEEEDRIREYNLARQASSTPFVVPRGGGRGGGYQGTSRGGAPAWSGRARTRGRGSRGGGGGAAWR